MRVTYEQFEDVIVTALEGGSNHWYLLDLDEVYSKHRRPKGVPTSIFLADLIWNRGYGLKVYDLEDEEELLGIITKESFLDNMLKDPRSYADMMTNNLDANSADNLFQLGVMGDLIFG